jgi:hypothetical protein
MQALDFGEVWIRRFDEATARGTPAREVMLAMAADITRLGALATRQVELHSNIQITAPTCPHCGKPAIGTG